jgi:penicillin amidase
MISANDVFTMEDMMRMQADQHSCLVRRVQKMCWPILLEADLRGNALIAFDWVHAWDGLMDMDDVRPTLFEVFYGMLEEAVFKDELGDHYPEYLQGATAVVNGVMDRILDGQEIHWCDDIRTPDTSETISDLVVPAWNAAIRWLEENYGPEMESWVWGDLHTLSLKHPLAAAGLLNRLFNLERGPYRVGGSFHTVSPYSYPGFSFSVTNGASQRHIYNLLDPDDSRIIVPSGISGIPASTFFCNQTALYIRNEYMDESFSPEKVQENARYRCVFYP